MPQFLFYIWYVNTENVFILMNTISLLLLNKQKSPMNLQCWVLDRLLKFILRFPSFQLLWYFKQILIQGSMPLLQSTKFKVYVSVISTLLGAGNTIRFWYFKYFYNANWSHFVIHLSNLFCKQLILYSCKYLFCKF